MGLGILFTKIHKSINVIQIFVSILEIFCNFSTSYMTMFDIEIKTHFNWLLYNDYYTLKNQDVSG